MPIMKIKDTILERFNNVRERIAEGIHDGDWSAVGWNAALILAVVMVIVTLGVVVLALVWKVLGSLLGKIIAVPLVLFILGLSYKLNFEDSRKARQTDRDAATLKGWAEQVYEYVRDSLFYVLQAMANGTNIIEPQNPYVLEMDRRFYIQDGYAVFPFFVQRRGTLDKERFQRRLTATMVTMHKNHQLVGVTTELVNIGGLPYCPLQVLDVRDYDDGFVVELVFADEQTIQLVNNAVRRSRKTPGQGLFDDEL